MIRCETQVLGRTIRAEAVQLDDGWDVSVLGGCRTHIGAVTFAGGNEPAQTLLRQGHREEAVTERWARTLAQAWGEPVCVRAGIHYDQLDAAGIRAVLDACDRLLEMVVEQGGGR